MTRTELDNHFRMIRQLHDAQEIQQAIFARAGMEKGDAVRQAIISDCLDDISQRIARYKHLLTEASPAILDFIYSTKSPRMQQILRLRYLHGFAWCEISKHIDDGTSEQACKVACYRFLKANCI